MRRNVEEFPQFVRLAHELGADEVNASHLIVMRKEQNDESLLFHKELCNRVLEEARSVANEVGIRLSQPPPYVLEPVAPAPEQATPGRKGERVTCPYLWQQSYISVDGTVMPCCHPQQPVVGNLREKSFREIWNGPLYQEMRARLDTADPYPCCKNCPVLEQRGDPGNAEAFLQGS
jgi:radical SAM protein with 4Fe4S-binding SPASM domain